MPLDTSFDPATHKFKIVGSRPVRPDGIDKVTGRAKFGADANAPGMLVGKILRSPHAHAKIRSIDTSTAIARKALKLIAVDYEILPHVTDVDAAMKPGAPILHKDMITANLDPAP